MASSRKNQAGLRLAPVCAAVLICVAIVASCVGYVWQKRQIGELSKAYMEQDAYLKRLRDQNLKLRNQIVVLRSPQVLDQRAKDLKLGLGLPQAGQIWRLPEPAVEVLAPPAATPQTKPRPAGTLAAR